ncbi:MAG: demethoxyubiquinone hydroxylase family protein, partial [Luminiphilus sp.]|nr:demethoxyubiquinone hydroxylase family protein [Luminiphilus sp.]
RSIQYGESMSNPAPKPAQSVPNAANAPRHSLPAWLIADLRSDHAGEMGAVMIYRGILAVSRDAAVREFAQHHLATEETHLQRITALLQESQHTRLLPLWRVMGWLTGALPAMLGANSVFVTIEAVETFVDHHYQEQLNRIDPEGKFADIRGILADCQADEVAHRDEAKGLATQSRGPMLSLWALVVKSGSAAAVWAARRI